MCGICGLYDPHQRFTGAQRAEDIAQIMAEFRYRGPDEQGTYQDEPYGVALGHVRLSIIDLSGGKQPMQTPNGRLHIVFNGEIYNFKAERQALEKTGYRFQTHSDTEVILALYECYGEDAWSHLRGQFAFALWDSQEKVVHLVRDRMGEKPLVYAQREGALLFASELKALLRSRAVPRRLDRSQLGLYLLMQHVPAPGTLIEGVKKLPPGYALKATPQGITLRPFWKPQVSRSLGRAQEGEAIEEFRRTFEESVALCTVSDVPIGTYLSGGLDSTAVTWAATKARSEPLHSFAIFNREKHEQHPDWKYAQEAARALGTQHHNIFYDLSELMRQIPEFIERTDEPFEGPTALVSLYLSKATREHVKVVLTGSGGDELMAGYQAYYQQVLKNQNVWQSLDQAVPRPIRTAFAAILGIFHPQFRRIGMGPGERRIAGTLNYHARWFEELCPDLGEITRQRFVESVTQHHADALPNYFKRFLWEDLVVNHHHALTTLPDATGMACSLEARNPFLDYRLVEFVLALEPELLIRDGFQNKYLLTKAMEGRLPDSILTRKKEGFSGMTGEQIIRWMTMEGRPMFRDGLLGSTLVKDGVLPRQGIETLWKAYEQATSIKEAIYFQIPIWSATLLELWYRRLGVTA